jgi:RNA polymerase Rpb1, domain 5
VIKGMRRVIIETDEGTRHEYSVPRSVHVNVQEGERVPAGDPRIDGPSDPHDVLAVLGIKELQRYLVDKIQEVYRSQSVAINDKHIEVICRQMLPFRPRDPRRRYGLPRGRAGRSLPLHGREREGHETWRRTSPSR